MIKPKKSYGQHFLINEEIAQQIVSFIHPFFADLLIIEIGPGKGVLTKYLLDESCDFKCIEADRDMFKYLERHYAGLDDKLILDDFLKVDISLLFKDSKLALFGNFPYNISSQIIFKLLEYKEQIPLLIGMFQKEVGERIVASPGSKIYGAISVLVQAHFSGKILLHVPPQSFSPPPKVQSVVIQLERQTPRVSPEEESHFKRIVKMSFGQRRKMLRNSLKSLISDPSLLKSDIFVKRPEQLSVKDFVYITQLICKT